MADTYTFYPDFKEYIPMYQGVSKIEIGKGENGLEFGYVYATFSDGRVEQIGPATAYNLAQSLGFVGSAEDWIRTVMGVASLVKGATAEISYMTTTNGENHPEPTAEGWTETPHPEKGKFVWTKIDLTWIDSTTTTIYMVAQQGEDGQVESVNGATGAIVLNGTNLVIDAESEQTIKQYIDNLVFEPEVATNTQIDALFGIEPEPEPEPEP